jgi:hypothetical protein
MIQVTLQDGKVKEYLKATKFSVDEKTGSLLIYKTEELYPDASYNSRRTHQVVVVAIHKDWSIAEEI